MINTNVEVHNASASGFSQDKCYLPLINKMVRFWSRPLSLSSPVFSTPPPLTNLPATSHPQLKPDVLNGTQHVL